ncbi:uncharacterized protein LOC124802493 isoform X1 [Schistocerca piceifrons]|uniref:uncharacterized protein LOC124802493 isoform X1 n=1 Tax=Schistocerca piceifrons TaxID=274613 RepID=UPI001F5F22ED|nr:uncharacterized protein LOC124802493 isoform X1 [Schistocerca piceifrons]
MNCCRALVAVDVAEFSPFLRLWGLCSDRRYTLKHSCFHSRVKWGYTWPMVRGTCNPALLYPYRALQKRLGDSFGGDTEWFEQQNGDAEIELSRDSLPQASNGSISQLWAGPARDIALGTEGAAAVRAAMEGFNLPPTAVPAWASNVPEEQWTDMLRQRITTLQQHRQQRQAQEESPSV